MSFKQLFPDHGTYDVTPPLTELQERCNELTSVINSKTESPVTYTTTIEIHPHRPTLPTSSTSRESPIPSPSTMVKNPANMQHVDAIVEVEPTSNFAFHSFEMDRRSQKSHKSDPDTASNNSNGSRCENCMVNCLYYTNECCDCTIL